MVWNENGLDDDVDKNLQTQLKRNPQKYFSVVVQFILCSVMSQLQKSMTPQMVCFSVRW